MHDILVKFSLTYSTSKKTEHALSHTRSYRGARHKQTQATAALHNCTEPITRTMSKDCIK